MISDVVYIGIIKVDTARTDGLLGVWTQRRWRPTLGAMGSLATVRQVFFRRSPKGGWEFSHFGVSLGAQAA